MPGTIRVSAGDACGKSASSIEQVHGKYGQRKLLRVYDGQRVFAGTRYYAIELNVVLELSHEAGNENDDGDDDNRWEWHWCVGGVERRGRDADSWTSLDDHEWSLHLIGKKDGKPRAPDIDRIAYRLQASIDASETSAKASTTNHVLLIHSDHEERPARDSEWKVRLVTFRGNVAMKPRGVYEVLRRYDTKLYPDGAASFIVKTKPNTICKADIETAMKLRRARYGRLCPCFISTCFCRLADSLGFDDDVALGADDIAENSCYCCAGACGTQCECFLLGCAGHGDDAGIECLPSLSYRTDLTRHDGSIADELMQPLHEGDVCTLLCLVLGYILCFGMCCSPASRTDISYHRWLPQTQNLPQPRRRGRGSAHKYEVTESSSSHAYDDGDDDGNDDENANVVRSPSFEFTIVNRADEVDMSNDIEQRPSSDGGGEKSSETTTAPPTEAMERQHHDDGGRTSS